jgi:hypothetical protein
MKPGVLSKTSWRMAVKKAPEGWAHSKTLARIVATPSARSVLECGGPPSLSSEPRHSNTRLHLVRAKALSPLGSAPYTFFTNL